MTRGFAIDKLKVEHLPSPQVIHICGWIAIGPEQNMAQGSFSFKSNISGMKKMGEYLKGLRKELGLSMHEVSKRTGLTPGYISKIEAGSTFKSITVQTLLVFSNTYQIPVTAILEETDFLEESKDDLPNFAIYLKAKYKLPHQAVRDLELAKEIVEKKYRR